MCKKQFQYSASLRAHLIRHTRKDAPTSSSSNSTSNEASGASSEKGRTKREFICSICGRTLPKLYSLRIHMLKHTGVKPHACQVRACVFISFFKEDRKSTALMTWVDMYSLKSSLLLLYVREVYLWFIAYIKYELLL